MTTKNSNMNVADVTKNIDAKVLAVIGSPTLAGFEKAHLVAVAISEMKVMMTDQYMQPILSLQGTKLGFRTDKDKTGGYPVDVVRTCLIEAVLVGVQPVGNHFNIISGNMYLTKEGCGYLLNRYKKKMGLRCDIICSLPRISADKTSAAVDVTIKWTMPGQTPEPGQSHANGEVIPIPIKIDQYASVDSVIGKATRKARAWLLSTITGVELIDGEVEDAKATVISSTVRESTADIEMRRIKLMISDCKTIEEVDLLQESHPDIDVKLFDDQKALIKKGGTK